MRVAVQPLIDHFGVELVDDGTALRSPAANAPIAISSEELGCSADHQSAPRTERTQKAERALPATLSLSYYDPERDYQTGQMRAALSSSGAHEAAEMPASMAADFAKALAHSSLARRWAQRELLTLRLPPSFMSVSRGRDCENLTGWQSGRWRA